MKRVLYLIGFFILFFIIQQLPYLFDHKTRGFPLTTYTYWFEKEHTQWGNGSITTTHVIWRPENIYINFGIYVLVVFFVYCYKTKQNPFKLALDKTIRFLKSKSLRKTLVLLGYSFIIFAIVQFIPYHRDFKNGVAGEIGYPNRAYYIVDAQCYHDVFFEPIFLVLNFMLFTTITFLTYFTIKLFKMLYNKLQTIKQT